MNNMDNKSWTGKKQEKPPETAEALENKQESEGSVDGSSALTAFFVSAMMFAAAGDVAAHGHSNNYGSQNFYRPQMENTNQHNQRQQNYNQYNQNNQNQQNHGQYNNQNGQGQNNRTISSSGLKVVHDPQGHSFMVSNVGNQQENFHPQSYPNQEYGNQPQRRQQNYQEPPQRTQEQNNQYSSHAGTSFDAGLHYKSNEKGNRYAVDPAQEMRNLQEYAALGIHSQVCEEGGASFENAPALSRSEALRLAERLIHDGEVNGLSREHPNVIKVKTTVNYDGTGKKFPGVITIEFDKSWDNGKGGFIKEMEKIDGSNYQVVPPAGAQVWYADKK